MVKVFVDSGSSIKQEEKEKLGVEILPLKIMLDEKEYLDGVDLSIDEFYDALINKNLFPKTSLPSLADAEDRVSECTQNGDDVIILTISSGISGTYNTFKMLFADNLKVRVIDSKCAVGGMRLLVHEINKYRNESLDFIEEKVNKLIPRIKIIAIPETLDYLHKGGRLSKTAKIAGNLMHLKPLLGIDTISGHVKMFGKSIGLKRAMLTLAEYLEKEECDADYKIIPSYTYNKQNLDRLISLTDEKYKALMDEYDNLDPAIACHWGPNAFGYIFVGK